jgi:hypothetical protein
MSGSGWEILQTQNDAVIAVIVRDVVEELDVTLAGKSIERPNVLDRSAREDRRAGGGLNPGLCALIFKSFCE